MMVDNYGIEHPPASEIVSKPGKPHDSTILAADDGYGWYVASKSHPRRWWHVTDDLQCGCPGYMFRGNCRHVRLLVSAGLPDPSAWADGDFML